MTLLELPKDLRQLAIDWPLYSRVKVPSDEYPHTPNGVVFDYIMRQPWDEPILMIALLEENGRLSYSDRSKDETMHVALSSPELVKMVAIQEPLNSKWMRMVLCDA